MRGSASAFTRATSSAGGSTLVHSIFGCRMSATSSAAASSSSRIPLCATSSPFTISGSVRDRKSTRLNSSHLVISYAVFCLKKKKKKQHITYSQQPHHTSYH